MPDIEARAAPAGNTAAADEAADAADDATEGAEVALCFFFF